MEINDQIKGAMAAIRALKNQRNSALDALADKSAECDILANRLTEMQKDLENYKDKFDKLSKQVEAVDPVS